MTVRWHGAELTARIQQAAMAGVAEWIGLVDEKAVDLILNTNKSGRIYRRRGVVHQASAPGEPPASDTGNLLNNRRIDLFPDRLAARLTFSARYALPLEMGTRNMDPRPFANRALEETEEVGRERVASNVRAALL